MKKPGALLLAICGVALSVSPAGAELIYAIAGSNTLLSFDSATPGTQSQVAITGLQAGENILGIDLRPATGQLYALGSTSRLYTINPATGAATQVGSAGAFTLNGTSFGFDFNPTVDRIRIVSNTGQNIRLNPNDGTLAGTDTTLAYAGGDANAGTTPSDAGAAYVNNTAGAPSTTLFGIDTGVDILVRQGSVDGTPISPNTGQLFTIGSLGVNPTDASFDVSGVTGIAYATLCSGLVCGFYTINLSTGAAALVGGLTTQTPINGMTVAGQGPTPTPTATATATATATPTATATATNAPTLTPTLSGGAAAAVPTLSGWGLAVMVALLAALGYLVARSASSGA